MNKQETSTFHTSLIRIKVTVNGFHLFRSFHQKESVDFLSILLQICTRGWHLTWEGKPLLLNVISDFPRRL
jgi:hypothetical protein